MRQYLCDECYDDGTVRASWNPLSRKRKVCPKCKGNPASLHPPFPVSTPAPIRPGSIRRAGVHTDDPGERPEMAIPGTNPTYVPLDVTAADIEAIEDAVGMSAGGWDMVNPRELVAATWNRLRRRR